MFPFYAFLIADSIVDTIWQLAYVMPFVFAMSAGFIYNSLCDAPTDPESKNPITRGDFTGRQAKVSVIGMSGICLALSIVIYSNWLALATMTIYLLFWLLYSGLRVRLKESLLAPAVASYVLWTGPPSILLIQFSYFGMNELLLLFSLFFVYVGHEIKHTIIEYEMDARYGSRTFSVIVGQRRAAYAEYLSLSAGFFIMVVVCYSLLWGTMQLAVVCFIFLFVAALAMTIVKGVRSSFRIRKDTLSVTVPYISTKVFIIFLGTMIIGLPSLVALFILWMFLIEPYP
jgi:4-hydroxybenzoate polyprenyltransferase